MRWFKLAAVLAIVTLVTAVALVAQDSTATPVPGEQELSDLMAYLAATGFGVVSSFLLGAFKKIQGVVDAAWWKLIKPVQPYVVAALTFLIPVICDALGIVQIDPQVFIAAPFGTVVAVGARNVFEILKKKWGASA